MSKKPRRARQAKPATRTASSIPPLAAAIATLSEPHYNGIHDHFLRAWAAMPAVLEAYANGNVDDLGTTSRGTLIDAMVEEEIARSRTSDDFCVRMLAAAYDALEAADPDYWGSVAWALEGPAFHVGLALGVYVMLNGGAR